VAFYTARFEGRFSTASDVWSFGVCVWEIASFGAPPYPGMVGARVIKFIEEGRRLKIHPQTNKVYPTVQPMLERCWSIDVPSRPTFRALMVECRVFEPDIDF
jgi:serine/threonine protein kinase